jgi:hypothetical protein
MVLNVGWTGLSGSLADPAWHPIRNSLHSLAISKTKLLPAGPYPNLKRLIAK